MKTSGQGRLRADMHIHSRYSDGSLWPAEIVARASDEIQVLCLTDHDTMGGVPEFLEATKAKGISAWPAVEIDCVDQKLGYKSEVLAYFPEGRYRATETLVSVYRKIRNDRINEVFERAKTLFHKPGLDFGQVLESRISGRPDTTVMLDPTALRFAKTDVFFALLKAGVLPPGTDYREFRKAYFDTGLFADIKVTRPTVEEIAGAVKEDGGHMVIPHLGHEFGDNPQRLATELPRLQRWLKRFMKLGIRGMELYRYRNGASEALNELIRREALALGYFFTHGSDCHGPGSGKDSEGRFWDSFDGFPLIGGVPAGAMDRTESSYITTNMTMNGKD
jgi:hypothetical protein